jgi:tRNA A-37 threonylcarbamoyl transferase component Bud32
LEIRLVDLHGARVLENASEPERERNRDRMLSLLRMSLRLPVSRAVEKMSGELRKPALLERSRRCLKINRDFSLRHFGSWKWRVRSAAITAEMEKLFADPDAFIERGRSLKQGRSSTVAAANGLVLKRYNFKKPLNLIKDLFRGSRGRRGFRKAYHLELCGVATPRVLATADGRALGFPLRSYVLMEEVADAIDAGRWAGDLRLAARALAELIGRLHEEGFTHRDLKETNILFDARGKPFLIDLDGLNFAVDASAAEAADNLRRLAEGLRAAGKLTRQSTISFMTVYCRLRRLSPRQLFPREGKLHARRSS